jgi:hypothetical protein
MGRVPPTGLAATLAAVVALLGATGAGADGGAKTKIKLGKLAPTGASGAVRSAKRSCNTRRKVSLFIYEGFVTDKVAITYTNKKGKWSTRKNLKPGQYFAKVDASRGCRYDVSKRKHLS